MVSIFTINTPMAFPRIRYLLQNRLITIRVSSEIKKYGRTFDVRTELVPTKGYSVSLYLEKRQFRDFLVQWATVDQFGG